MPEKENQAWGRLALVLAVAILIRLPHIFFQTPLGRDAIEYQNIARHLNAGEGLTLDIKVYYAVDSPVRHYAGSTRAPLLPLLLAGAERIMPAGWAIRALGPALFIGALLLAYSALARGTGKEGAFWAALLLAAHPGLLPVSLSPLSEVVVLFFIAAAMWSFMRMESAALAGLACAAAFLARPNAAIAALVIAAWYLIKRRDRSGARDAAIFFALFLIGPVALAAINSFNGAPMPLTPQNFLFRVLNFGDGAHFMHRGPIYGSTIELVRTEGAVKLLRMISKNGFYYLTELLTTWPGLGCLLPMAAVAWIGVRKSGKARILAPLAAIGVVNLVFHAAVWATYDAERFLSLTYFTLILWIAAGACLALGTLDSERGATTGGRSLVRGFFLVVLLMYGFQDAHAGYMATRNYQTGKTHSGQLADVWDRADVQQMRARMLALKQSGAIDESTVIASNEPWLANEATGSPSALIPYDLRPEEWKPWLKKVDASWVLLHKADWPAAYGGNLAALEGALAEDGWTRDSVLGEIELWRAGSGRTP